MSKNVIFCFSGSGNCLDIAKNIAKELGDTDIIMMRKKPVMTNVYNAATVGFVFPCYAGGLPGDVEKYIKTLNVGWQSYTYSVVSYAGYPGVGHSKINKYVPLDYWNGISHHCSCIWLFPHKLMMPIFSSKNAQSRSEKLAKQIAQDVINRVKCEGVPPENILNKVEATAWPYLADKKSKELSVNVSSCTKCGQCAKICPRENISIVDGIPSFGSNCMGCLSCLQYCPTQAIDIGSVSYKRERYHNDNIQANELMKDIIHID